MKKPTILLVCLISLCLAALTYLYFKEKRNNLALRLQLQVLSKEKKPATPWKNLLKETKSKNKMNPNRTDEPPQKDSRETTENLEISDGQINDQTTEDLANFLDHVLKNIKTQPSEDSSEYLEDALQAANELIKREPNSYSAYKAKLILLLTSESTQHQEINENDLEQLLSEMASFDIESDLDLRKEAFLIAHSNSRIETLQGGIITIDDNLEEIENELETLAEDPEETKELELQKALLLKQKEEYSSEIHQLDKQMEDGIPEEKYILNSDVVQIPLQRWMAREEYSEVIEESEALIEEFPESPIGYLYLIQSLELTGRKDEALQIISESHLPKEVLDELELQLRRSRNSNPKDYWKRLRF